MNRKYRAIALYSGGLDSLLSVLWMQRLGVDVIPVFFKTPFFTEERAVQTALANKLKLEVIDITEEHLMMMRNPVYGFGKNFNPCIDCHGLMFNRAGKLLEQFQADFLISGEVLSQRPMSQRKDAMNAVAKLSGFRDLLIRPLSQQLLSDTKPIRDGWINKDDMLSLSGRSRKPQMQLAKELGIVEYQNPAGGCKLTDRNFSLRLQELLEHNQITSQNVNLLKFGRHFRLDDITKLIIGREEFDNDNILLHSNNYILLQSEEIPGPLGLLTTNDLDYDSLIHAAEILAFYYAKSPDPVLITYGLSFPLTSQISVKKANSETVQSLMITR